MRQKVLKNTVKLRNDCSNKSDQKCDLLNYTYKRRQTVSEIRTRQIQIQQLWDVNVFGLMLLLLYILLIWGGNMAIAV